MEEIGKRRNRNAAHDSYLSRFRVAVMTPSSFSVTYERKMTSLLLLTVPLTINVIMRGKCNGDRRYLVELHIVGGLDRRVDSALGIIAEDEGGNALLHCVLENTITALASQARRWTEEIRGRKEEIRRRREGGAGGGGEVRRRYTFQS